MDRQLVNCALGAGIFAADRISKEIVRRSMRPGERRGKYIQYIQNRGFALNRLDDHPKVVQAGSAAAAAACLAALAGTALDPQQAESLLETGLVLVAAGGVSNSIDRIREGYVVDFVSLPAITPARRRRGKRTVYNIADFSIFAGTAVIAAQLLRK